MGPFVVDGLGWYLVTDADPDEPQFEEGWVAAGAEPAPFLASTGEIADPSPFVGLAGGHRRRRGGSDRDRRRRACHPLDRQRPRRRSAAGSPSRSSRPAATRSRRSAPRWAQGIDRGTLQPQTFDALGVRGPAFATVASDCAWALVILRAADPNATPGPVRLADARLTVRPPIATVELSRPPLRLGTCGGSPDRCSSSTACPSSRRPISSATSPASISPRSSAPRSSATSSRPHTNDRELDVIRRRGFEHEARYLAELRADGRDVVEIHRDDDADRGEQIRRQAAATTEAMASGADVIFQATFFDGRWLGYADFLLKVIDPERPSAWGPWHYEVADTKLARHVKAGAVLQICSYVEQLERVQGVRPRQMHVVLGGSARETATLRVDDYLAYYRAAKARFEATVLDEAGRLHPTSPSNTYPEPVDHCGVCRWAVLCAQRRRDDDHLSLVAGITGRQRTALATREIDTVVRLANAPIPFDPPLDGSSAVERRARARAGTHPGRRARAPEADPRAPRCPAHGAADRAGARPCQPAGAERRATCSSTSRATPSPSTTGSTTCSAYSTPSTAFTPIWSTDPDRPDEITLAGEKAAFERLIDLLMARLALRPEMHIYHYAPYEPTALEAADGPPCDPRGRGGSPAARRRAGRPVSASFARASAPRSRATASSVSSLSTTSSAPSRSRTPGRASWRSRSGSSSARAIGRPPASSTRSPRYNRDDVVSTATPPRLARAPPRRAARRNRPGGPAARAACRATRPCSSGQPTVAWPRSPRG